MTTQYDHPTKEEVIAYQRESLAAFGGQDGIRDVGLLESALARAQQHEFYAGNSIFDMAAIYCEAIIKNHPFLDGNKRCGFITAVTFLDLNGYFFDTDEKSVLETILKVAMSDISHDDLSKWFSDHSYLTTQFT